MLRTRLLVALIALPLLVAVTVVGGVWFEALLLVVLVGGAWELHALGAAAGQSSALPVSWLLIVVFLDDGGSTDVLRLGVTLGVVLAMAAALRAFHRDSANPLLHFALTLSTGLYLGGLGGHLLLLRGLPDGAWWLLTVLFAVFAADTGGYVIGKRWGRHKMDALASPGKSWEGYAGGVLFAAGEGVIAGLIAPALMIPHTVMLAVLIALLAPLGDLAVSAFKRAAGVKDASGLIPGHGGLMDRLDTVLIAGAVAYHVVRWLVG